MKKVILALIILISLTSCGPSELDIQRAIEQTQASKPTQTDTTVPTQTDTTVPTETKTATPTPKPTSTNTLEPTAVQKLDEVYSAFISKYKYFFDLLVEDQELKDLLKFIDVFFDEGKEQSNLQANIGVDYSLQREATPFALPVVVVRNIIQKDYADYPKDLDYFVITLFDDMTGIKYISYEIEWGDYLDFVNGKITFEQMFSRMEQIKH